VTNEAIEKPRTLSTFSQLTMFANILTMIRIVLTPVFIVTFLADDWQWRVASLVIFVAAAITDWWDGYHARKSKSVTKVGRFLDPFADKLLTISAMLTFAWAFKSVAILVMVIIIFTRDFLLTWLRIRAESHGHAFTTLWFAKMKTSVQLTVIITIIVIWGAFSLGQAYNICADCISKSILIHIFEVMIGATLVLAVISAGQYLKRISTGEQLL
jgi:CDP-diacylglycerol--glycerol-3-phosphate 3-phosphatidyltransferase